MSYGYKCLLCKNTRHRDRNCRLFKFPSRGSPMWLRWLEACGLQEADFVENSRLCHRHFQKKDFLTRRLTGMAVPSVFPLTVHTELFDQQAHADFVSGLLEDKADDQRQLIEEVYQLDDISVSEADDLIEYNGSIRNSLPYDGNEAALEIELLASSKENNTESTDEESSVSESCNVKAHENLSEQLQREREKVELLTGKLSEKEKVIEEQYEILEQLGVRYVITNDE
ncbi:uncharacterized protein LOC131436739 [Malaya genurostris]|uniref:uncharacterized protein LOC131436739 n=1 Tax=Malaya genurostris TaxID=325434 RepID=UPI0026F3F0EB|nr:uncharacterized protein LOC131436739 [Malaya genurostris]